MWIPAPRLLLVVLWRRPLAGPPPRRSQARQGRRALAARGPPPDPSRGGGPLPQPHRTPKTARSSSGSSGRGAIPIPPRPRTRWRKRSRAARKRADELFTFPGTPRLGDGLRPGLPSPGRASRGRGRAARRDRGARSARAVQLPRADARGLAAARDLGLPQPARRPHDVHGRRAAHRLRRGLPLLGGRPRARGPAPRGRGAHHARRPSTTGRTPTAAWCRLEALRASSDRGSGWTRPARSSSRSAPTSPSRSSPSCSCARRPGRPTPPGLVRADARGLGPEGGGASVARHGGGPGRPVRGARVRGRGEDLQRRGRSGRLARRGLRRLLEARPLHAARRPSCSRGERASVAELPLEVPDFDAPGLKATGLVVYPDETVPAGPAGSLRRPHGGTASPAAPLRQRLLEERRAPGRLRPVRGEGRRRHRQGLAARPLQHPEGRQAGGQGARTRSSTRPWPWPPSAPSPSAASRRDRTW